MVNFPNCGIMRYFYDFRSQKLIVTKENRENLRRNDCRQVFCIAVAVLFIASAISVGTLIGGMIESSIFSGKGEGIIK